MNSLLRNTIFAMATTALSVTAACARDAGPSASEDPAGNGNGVASAETSEAGCGEGGCGEGDCGGSGGEDGAG